MITRNKLDSYIQSRENRDGKIKLGNMATVSEDEQFRLDELVERLNCEASGETSSEYRAETRRLMKEHLDGEQTMARLQRYCGVTSRPGSYHSALQARTYLAKGQHDRAEKAQRAIDSQKFTWIDKSATAILMFSIAASLLCLLLFLNRVVEDIFGFLPVPPVLRLHQINLWPGFGFLASSILAIVIMQSRSTYASAGQKSARTIILIVNFAVLIGTLYWFSAQF